MNKSEINHDFKKTFEMKNYKVKNTLHNRDSEIHTIACNTKMIDNDIKRTYYNFNTF